MKANVDLAAANKGRAMCPKCERNGLGYANHPHAFGYKDYSRLRCRYCKSYFTIKPE